VSDAYANELENWFNSFPSVIQGPIRPIFDKMNEGLRWVAGNPQELTRAGDVYVQIGDRLHALVQEQITDRGKLSGHWTGAGYDAFTKKMTDVEGKLDKLAESTKKTKEVLDAAAKAAVEGANMIIDIIVTALSFMLAELAINAALSVLTFGASLLAMVAEWIANGVAALAQIFRVVGKVAQVLEKLYEILMKLAEIFKMIASFFRALKELLAALKELKSGASGLGKVGWFAAHAGAKFGAAKVIQGVSGGNVAIPGMAGEGVRAGKDYKNAWDDANQATNAAQ
jgi:uncharacterized protein YukE